MKKPIALSCPDIQMALCADDAGEKYVVIALDDKVQMSLCLNAALNMFDSLGECLHEAGALDEDADNSQLRMH